VITVVLLASHLLPNAMSAADIALLSCFATRQDVRAELRDFAENTFKHELEELRVDVCEEVKKLLSDISQQQRLTMPSSGFDRLNSPANKGRSDFPLQPAMASGLAGEDEKDQNDFTKRAFKGFIATEVKDNMAEKKEKQSTGGKSFAARRSIAAGMAPKKGGPPKKKWPTAGALRQAATAKVPEQMPTPKAPAVDFVQRPGTANQPPMLTDPEPLFFKRAISDDDVTPFTKVEKFGGRFPDDVDVVDEVDDPAQVVEFSANSDLPSGMIQGPLRKAPMPPSMMDAARRVKLGDDDKEKPLVSIGDDTDSVKSEDTVLSRLGSEFEFDMSSEEEDDDDEASYLKGCLQYCQLMVLVVVTSSAFETIVAFCIVLNALMIGVQTNHASAVWHMNEETPAAFDIIDKVFCVIFTVEITLRIFAFGSIFFVMSGWHWNIFDLVLVAMQLVDEALSFLFAFESSVSLSFTRVLRGLRVVRLVRLVRVLRLIRELRTIVVSIANSMKSLLWTIVLLLFLVYVVGVVFTQMVNEHGKAHPEQMVDSDQPLVKFYGSVPRTLFTLYEATMGGVDWDDVCRPLMDQISPWVGIIFALYIAFTVLAVMNVVTGVFVESALQSAMADRDVDLVTRLRELFMRTDADLSGVISWSEFQSNLDQPEMKFFFRSIDLDLSEARGLFRLLDVDESGEIDAEEFVMGCLRLRGNARSIDLVTIMNESRRSAHRWMKHAVYVERVLNTLMEAQAVATEHLQEMSPALMMSNSDADAKQRAVGDDKRKAETTKKCKQRAYG